MSFSSAIFIFAFFPISVLINYIIKDKYKNWWLLFCSIFFYAWAQPQYLWLIALIVVINYCSALIIAISSKPKFLLVVAILLNLLGLLYFKYSVFAVETFNSLTGSDIPLKEVVLPLGISFYTFKGISYIADVYTKKYPPEKNFFKLLLYIMIFPQIMSGPIDSYDKLAPSMQNHCINIDSFAIGIKRFILGISQKMIIANTLGAVVDNIWSSGAGSIATSTAWLGSIAYTLQIYFDFAGYSNMAIGIGKMLGFEFSENFDLPYTAKSIAEFWRRWHITLGEWFKKYIYIPLGGNRKSVARGYINLSIVFLLTGIWHGASWTFILWGIFHGFFRILEKLLQNKIRLLKIPESFKSVLSHVYLLVVVNFGWVLFRAPDLQSAHYYIEAMFGKLNDTFCGISTFYYLSRWNVFVIIIAIMFSTSLPRKVVAKIRSSISESCFIIVKDLCLFSLLLLSILEVVTNTYQTFIYFQF